MSSGVKVHNEVMDIYQLVKLGGSKKGGLKIRWVVFGIDMASGMCNIRRDADFAASHPNRLAGAEGEKYSPPEDGVWAPRTDSCTDDYAGFVEYIMANKKEPCFAVFDAEYKTANEGQHRSKIAFFFCCDDNEADRKKKMIYSSSKDAIFRKLEGCKYIQCNDDDELQWTEVVGKLMQGDRD